MAKKTTGKKKTYGTRARMAKAGPRRPAGARGPSMSQIVERLDKQERAIAELWKDVQFLLDPTHRSEHAQNVEREMGGPKV